MRTGCYIFLITFGLWLVADQTIRIYFPKLFWPEHFSISNEFRAPAPYIEFKGAPNADDLDEHGYRWVPAEPSKDALKIAFFGGSAGLIGNPPLPTLLETHLRNSGLNVQVANFSVISSVHRQHLHNIIESRSLFKPDIVIFYGGINEITQPELQDPRPGYPYNYYYRNETPSWAKILLQSPTFYALHLSRVLELTPLSDVRLAARFRTPHWREALENNYFETLEMAKTITEAFDSDICGGKTKFFFFFQPAREISPTVATVHAKVRSRIHYYSYGYDLTESLDGLKNVYIDQVHVKDPINKVLANKIATALQKSLTLSDCLETLRATSRPSD